MADLAGKTRIWTETQGTTSAVTKAAPTLITEGMSLEDVDGFRVSVAVDTGVTFSGAGSLLCYQWDTDLAAWIRNGELDISLTTGAPTFVASQRRLAFADQEVKVPSGRVHYACSGVTFSAGSAGVVVRIKAWLRSTRG